MLTLALSIPLEDRLPIDQECYEHVKNAKTAHTTQLTTESISVKSTEENVYQSTSVTPMENSARLVQNIDNQNTPSHM